MKDKLKQIGQTLSNSEDDFSLFQASMKGIKPLQQDKVVHEKKAVTPSGRQKQRAQDAIAQKQSAASFEFSDVFQAKLPDEGPMRYCREDKPTYLLKQLRRGDFSPELILDLHGLTKQSTKHEVAAMIHTARKQRLDCVAIVHGLGGGVLKQALPHYLVQHPHVLAFHQAPLEYGGQGALVVLLELDESQSGKF